ncbi:flavin reductase [Mesotoga sp. HF07.pep.5.2.highcov]|nr:flavin reductase family protein [Thermotogota bacterium]MCP5460541.1 flavin reductase family protein [Thermotogota bacterium]RLL89633.1 flavin reductase [Mesotoga sp. HF07.pep.5.2.highcov]
MPVVVIGTMNEERPNYTTIALCGVVEVQPPMIQISLAKSRLSCKNIEDTGYFSVNVPSLDMLRGVDYMGIHSGKTTDKSELFRTFPGEKGNVPMIEEAPLNMECELVSKFEFGGAHIAFVGEVVQTYCSESCLVDGLPNIKKISPVTFSVYDNSYWSIGMHLGKAWNIGIKYTPPKEGTD